MLLVDTSVWIAVFKQPAFPLEDHVPVDEVVTCLPIIQEVLQGFRDDLGFRRARESMLAFPCLESPMSLGLVEQAVDLYRRARRGGVTVRSSIDCLIAAMAIRHGIAVMHRDRDFANLAQVSDLKHVPV